MNHEPHTQSELIKHARQASAEGIVLLQNHHNCLPLSQGTCVSVFGRIQSSYYKSGTGSGGLVNVPYTISILEGLRNSPHISINEELVHLYEAWVEKFPFDFGDGWGKEPWAQTEMPLEESVVAQARSRSDMAVVIIGRTAGEDQDNRAEPGAYYLSQTELEMITLVARHFPKTVVVLNVGNIIDMSWVATTKVPAVLYAWQGGQEGGHAVADILTGLVCPSGKLTDTISHELKDHPAYKNFGSEKENYYQEDIYVGYRYFETFAPKKVLYPFGFGLSYTNFTIKGSLSTPPGKLEPYSVTVGIKNTGPVPGKEVVQVYVQAPQGKLGKPTRVLVGFAKTSTLQPGEEETKTLSIPLKHLASYDDSGATGHPYSWVVEAGTYNFFLGTDVRSATLLGTHEVPQTLVIEELSQALAPQKAFTRLHPKTDARGTITETWEAAPLQRPDTPQTKSSKIPHDLPQTGNKGYQLAQVHKEEITLETFVAQLSDEELACLTRGEGMCSPKVTPGTASAFGGLTPALKAYGIPIACCADGPSGIRMDNGTQATSLPNGTNLACTWNPELIKKLYYFEGLELRQNKVDFLLGPGINIHRHPLNGRNFEYFSEDPYVTGVMTVAHIQGLHEAKAGGTLKHYACNNQEAHRHSVDSIVSERALREIYLRAFEMAVKEAQASAIMTAYNPINGIWTASNSDLNTTILRDQWGYQGFLMTDWWAKMNVPGGLPSTKLTHAMVQSQNDVYMVVQDALSNSNGDNTLEALSQGLITRGHLQRCAMNICRVLLSTQAMERILDPSLDSQEQTSTQDPTVGQWDGNAEHAVISNGTVLTFPGIANQRGKATTYPIEVTTTAQWTITCTMKATGSPLAQIPLTLFVDGVQGAVFVMNGTDDTWVTKTTTMNLRQGKRFFKLYFGQNGLTIRDMVFTIPT